MHIAGWLYFAAVVAAALVSITRSARQIRRNRLAAGIARAEHRLGVPPGQRSDLSYLEYRPRGWWQQW